MSWIKDVNHEMSKLDVSNKTLRKFGITIGVVFLIFSSWLYYKNVIVEITTIAFVIALFLMISGCFFPTILRRIYRYWMGMAFILGWFVSRILLTILFIFVLTPIAILAKFFKKDFLSLSLNKNSYWIKKELKSSNYEKMY